MLEPIGGMGVRARLDLGSFLLKLMLFTMAGFALLAPATGIAASSYPETIRTTDGLAAYWRLGETALPTAVNETGGTNGTYQGTPLLGQAGAITNAGNTAVQMNSPDDQVLVTHSAALNRGDGPLTLEAWVKRDRTATDGSFEAIVSKGFGAYGLFIQDNYLLLRQAGVGGVATSSSTITDTAWHHVVATKHGAAVKLYIDGADRTGAPIIASTLVDNNLDLQIGRSGDLNNFRGYIDEVAIYGDVLSPATVADHYNRGVSQDSMREAALLRYPYLTDVVQQYATVNWATRRDADAAVLRWAPAGNSACTSGNFQNEVPATKTDIDVSGVPEYQWEANLELAPNSQYCYRVYLQTDPELDLLGGDPTPVFRTQLPQGSSTPFSFAVFGDWGDDRTPIHQRNVMSRIKESGVRFALTTGDNSYTSVPGPDGTQTGYGDLDRNDGALFGPEVWGKVGASLPLFPVIGNHDMEEPLGPATPGCKTTPPHSTFLVNWPQDRAVADSAGSYCTETYTSPPGSQLPDQTLASSWYAFDAGNARFYVLEASWGGQSTPPGVPFLAYKWDYESHWKPTSRQYQWLENDLKTHPAQHKFAFLHYPIYSDSGSEFGSTYLQDTAEGLAERLGVQENLSRLLTQNGAKLAFTGHAHIYQRNAPDPNGLVTYVTGGGGALALPIGAAGCKPIDQYGLGWQFNQTGGVGSKCGGAPIPTSPAKVYHFLKVTVNGAQVTVTPIDSLGEPFDARTYDFGATPTPTCPPTCPPSPPTGGGGTPPVDNKPVADKSAPVQILSGSKTQDIDKLTVTVRTNEAGTVTAGGTVSVPGASKVYRFKSVKRTVKANTRTKISLKLARKPLKAAKRAMKRKKKLKARVTVTAKDAAANASKSQLSIKLKP